MTKKDEETEVTDPGTEAKTQRGNFSLVEIKTRLKIPDMEYEGLKSKLEAEDTDIFTIKKIKSELDKYKKMKAFN